MSASAKIMTTELIFVRDEVFFGKDNFSKTLITLNTYRPGEEIFQEWEHFLCYKDLLCMSKTKTLTSLQKR